MSLKKLINQCKKQDRKAQEKLYRQYSGKLFTLCLKYSESYSHAQDLLQDGFIKIFGKIDQYSGKGSFEGWMTRIIINTALKKSKKQLLYLSLDEDYVQQTEPDLDDEGLSLEFLIKIVQELPEAYRLVFNLYVMDGHSHKEIAQKLQISEGASKSNLARARMKLRQSIKNYYNSNSAKSL